MILVALRVHQQPVPSNAYTCTNTLVGIYAARKSSSISLRSYPKKIASATKTIKLEGEEEEVEKLDEPILLFPELIPSLPVRCPVSRDNLTRVQGSWNSSVE